MGKLDEYLDRAEGTVFDAPDAPQRIPAGIYEMRIQDAHVDFFGEKQLPTIMWELYIASGEYQGEMVPAFTALLADPDKPKRGQDFRLSRGKEIWQKFCDYAGAQMPSDMRDVEENVAAIQQAAPAFRARITVNRAGFSNVEPMEGLANGTPPPAPQREATEPAPQAEPEVAWQKGDRIVAKEDDGKERRGTIEAIGNDGIEVVFDDEQKQVYTVEPNEIEPEPGPEPVEHDADREKLIDLCAAYGVGFQEDDDSATLVAAISAAKIDPSTMDEHEKEFCGRLGVKLVTPRRKPTPAPAATTRPKAAPKKRAKRRR